MTAPFILILLLAPFFAQAEDGLSSRLEVDWHKGVFSLRVEAPIDRSGPNAATAESAARHSAENGLPSLFLRELGPIVVESNATVEDLLRQNRDSKAAEFARDPLAVRAAQTESDEMTAYRFASLAGALDGENAVGRRVYTRNSDDQRSIEILFEYNLHAVLKRLLGIQGAVDPEARPRPVGKNLVWTPSAAWTGLVIHATEPLPVHGERGREPARPCGFPAVYDSDMSPVIMRSMVKPERLAAWGVAAYTSEADAAASMQRVGPAPFRSYAVGVFGRYRSDLKIPKEDARKLLASESARRALSEGRVLIITR
jgi:hypothetical protein